MDLIILLAVFVAFLALAYVTYRNVYNLDSRLRKIEDILKNAQVVAEPIAAPSEEPKNRPAPPEDEDGNNPREQASLPNSVPQEISPYAGRYGAAGGDSFTGAVPGWGGEAGGVPPKVTVAKEDADTRTIEVIPDDADTGADGDDEEGSDVEVDDILDEMEREDVDIEEVEQIVPTLDVTTLRVADLKSALKTANIGFPSNAKKADLVRLVQDNNVSVQKSDGNGDGEEDES
jgi:hypothetical protein